MDKVELSLIPAEPAPQAGPGIVFGGVNVGAGGWVIVNGQPKKVPPRGPIMTMLESLSRLAVADEIADQDLRQQVRRYALTHLEGAITDERRRG